MKTPAGGKAFHFAVGEVVLLVRLKHGFRGSSQIG